MDFIKPSLIEPSVRVFTTGTLKHCKRLRDEYYSYIFNPGAFLLFIFQSIIIMKNITGLVFR